MEYHYTTLIKINSIWATIFKFVHFQKQSYFLNNAKMSSVPQTCPYVALWAVFRYILSIYINHAVLMMSVPRVRFQKGEGDLHTAASEIETNKTKQNSCVLQGDILVFNYFIIDQLFLLFMLFTSSSYFKFCAFLSRKVGLTPCFYFDKFHTYFIFIFLF